MFCGSKTSHNQQLSEHVEVTSVSYITDRSSRRTQLQEHLHNIKQIQYNSLIKMFRFYWNCICEALSQHNGSFRGYIMVLLYCILLCYTHNGLLCPSLAAFLLLSTIKMIYNEKVLLVATNVPSINVCDHTWSASSTVSSYRWCFTVGVLCIIGGHSRLLW